MEIEYLKKLNDQLTKRNNDLMDYNELLKEIHDINTFDNVVKMNKNSSKLVVKADNKSHENILKTVKDSGATLNKYINVPASLTAETANPKPKTGYENAKGREENFEKSDDFTEVQRKFARKKVRSIGTRPNENNNFSGPEQKVGLYLYRVNRQAKEEIKEYIQKKSGFEQDTVTVKEIPTTENRLRRYLVTAPIPIKKR